MTRQNGRRMTDESATSAMTLAKPPLLKLALWTGSIGLGAYLLRRFLTSRRGRIDVGAVSDAWLASQRPTLDEISYY